MSTTFGELMDQQLFCFDANTSTNASTSTNESTSMTDSSDFSPFRQSPQTQLFGRLHAAPVSRIEHENSMSNWLYRLPSPPPDPLTPPIPAAHQQRAANRQGLSGVCGQNAIATVDSVQDFFAPSLSESLYSQSDHGIGGPSGYLHRDHSMIFGHDQHPAEGNPYEHFATDQEVEDAPLWSAFSEAYDQKMEDVSLLASSSIVYSCRRFGNPDEHFATGQEVKQRGTWSTVSTDNERVARAKARYAELIESAWLQIDGQVLFDWKIRLCQVHKELIDQVHLILDGPSNEADDQISIITGEFMERDSTLSGMDSVYSVTSGNSIYHSEPELISELSFDHFGGWNRSSDSIYDSIVNPRRWSGSSGWSSSSRYSNGWSSSSDSSNRWSSSSSDIGNGRSSSSDSCKD
jgi:hypothetical protein